MLSDTVENRADGKVEQLLDRAERALADDLVPVGIFNDDALFRAEMDRIFGQTWVFVGHESEIPEPGDYVRRQIGLDSVIVTRGREGEINVLSNYCRHRGTELCLSDQGNAFRFRCRYHGWTYRNNGDWVAAPQLREAYGEPLDAREWGLPRAPRVGTHQGMIFASLSDDVPDLLEFLDGSAWALDLIMGLAPRGMRVIAPPDRWRIKTDWKIPSENFAGDAYHLGIAHQSIEQLHIAHGLDKSSHLIHTFEFENGHNFGGHAWTQFVSPEWECWRYPPEHVARFDLDKLSERDARIVRDKGPSVGTIFPNLSYIRAMGGTSRGGAPAVFTSFRQWQPVAPGLIEVWNWFFAWDFETEEEVARSHEAGLFAAGVGGLFDQDDAVLWQGPARAAESPWLKRLDAHFHLQQGRNSPIDQSPDPDWAGPGLHRTTSYGEHQQLSFYRQWLKQMQQGGRGA